jgi:hypothetical protein
MSRSLAIASTSKGPSNPGPEPDSPSQRLHNQREILDRLAEGEGIAEVEWEGVVEKCYVCSKTMLEAVFQAHSRDCWHVSVSDDELENEPDKWGCNT